MSGADDRNQSTRESEAVLISVGESKVTSYAVYRGTYRGTDLRTVVYRGTEIRRGTHP